MRTLKVSELVLDYDLYPRNNVDSHNVRCIIDAMENGVELPPIVIDKKSKRVVDGFHRTKASIRHGGPESEVQVVEKTYANESEMFLDAMRYNASHGARLDPCDRTRCTIIAERLSIPLDALAGALHTSASKLEGLRSDRTAKGAGGLIPLKRTNIHMAGRKLNKKQEAANERSSGMNQVFYVNQLIDLIDAKLLKLDDEKLIERLRVLHEMLDEVLAAVG